MEISEKVLSNLLSKACPENYLPTPSTIAVGGIFALKVEKIKVDFNERVFFIFVNPIISSKENFAIEIPWSDLSVKFKQELINLIKV